MLTRSLITLPENQRYAWTYRGHDYCFSTGKGIYRVELPCGKVRHVHAHEQVKPIEMTEKWYITVSPDEILIYDLATDEKLAWFTDTDDGMRASFASGSEIEQKMGEGKVPFRIDCWDNILYVTRGQVIGRLLPSLRFEQVTVPAVFMIRHVSDDIVMDGGAGAVLTTFDDLLAGKGVMAYKRPCMMAEIYAPEFQIGNRDGVIIARSRRIDRAQRVLASISA